MERSISSSGLVQAEEGDEIYIQAGIHQLLTSIHLLPKRKAVILIFPVDSTKSLCRAIISLTPQYFASLKGRTKLKTATLRFC